MSAVDLQTVMHRFLPQVSSEYRLSDRQRQVCAHIRDCRTAAMGTWLQVCDQCEYQAPRYLACRDRHCPKCQGRACATWCAEQTQRLLPVTYFHVVFTLPHELNDWVQRDPSAIYQRSISDLSATV